MCEARQQATFWHEIVEHINDIYEIELTHRQISIIAELIYQVLIDNDMLKDDWWDKYNELKV